MGHAVIDGRLPVLETVADALLHDDVELGALSGGEVLSDDIAAKRQRKSGLRLEPLAHVSDLLKALVRVGELPLVDDEADIDRSAADGVEDLIEGNDGMVEFPPEEKLGA